MAQTEPNPRPAPRLSDTLRNKRFSIFLMLTGALILILVGRLVYITAMQSGGDQTEPVRLPKVERGPILDRNGRILAITTTLDSVSAWVPRPVFVSDPGRMRRAGRLVLREERNSTSLFYLSDSDLRISLTRPAIESVFVFLKIWCRRASTVRILTLSRLAMTLFGLP